MVDAAGKRCPTYEDAVTFSCSGPGTFLGGYNSGIRYTINDAHVTSGYKLNVEASINRVFVPHGGTVYHQSDPELTN